MERTQASVARDGGRGAGAPAITNRWGEVPVARLDVVERVVFRGRPGAGFNHQAQLASDDRRLYLTWSSAARDEEEAGQGGMLAVSDDEGGSWSEPMLLAPARPGRHAPSVVVSSGIHVHGNVLVAFHGEWERYEPNRDAAREAARAAAGERSCFDVRTEARVSRDRGTTWSKPVTVVRDQFGFLPPIATSRGRLILPGHLGTAWTDDPLGLEGWSRALLPGLPADYVDDWYGRERGAALLGTPHRFNEACCYEVPGALRMMMRNENNTRLGVAESVDGGEHWSAPALTDFTNSVSRSHFGRLPDGRWFNVSCPGPPVAGKSPSTRTPRTPVVLALSEDGDRFDRHYVLGDDAQGAPRLEGHLKHGRYGYPFLHVRGGRALVAWSINKEDIAVASFALPRRG